MELQLFIRILEGMVVLLLALLIASVVRRKIIEYKAKKSKWHHDKPLDFGPDLGEKYRKESAKRSETRFRILSRIVQVGVFFIVFSIVIYLIPALRSLSYSLLAGAGILALIIGFAVQKSFANMFAGIFIAIYEPFRIGDYIKINEHVGVVEDVTLHHTVIRDWRNKRYIVPNGIISEEFIENYTIGSSDLFKTFTITIGYESDHQKAKEIILSEIKKHKFLIIPEEVNNNGEQIKQEPNVRIINWNHSGIDLRVGFWVNHPINGYKMKFDLLESIKLEFDKNDIQIPYPHRTILYKKDTEPKKRKTTKKKVAKKKSTKRVKKR